MTKKFELFFDRIKKTAGVSTDTELCEYLGLKKSTLSMWKKREKVDYDLLFTKFEHLNLNLHWLLTGEGENVLKQDQSVVKSQGQGGTTIEIDHLRELNEQLQKNNKDKDVTIAALTQSNQLFQNTIKDLEKKLTELRKEIPKKLPQGKNSDSKAS